MSKEKDKDKEEEEEEGSIEEFKEFIESLKMEEEEETLEEVEEEDAVLEEPVEEEEAEAEEQTPEPFTSFVEKLEKREKEEEAKRLALLGKPETAEYGIPPSGQTIVAQALAPQLGSDIVTLQKGKVDMRRFSILGEKEMRAIAYFLIRGYEHNVKFWRLYVENFLNLAVSVGGVGRKQLIEMQKATQSLGGIGGEEEEKLSWIERHITKRGEAKKD